LNNFTQGFIDLQHLSNPVSTTHNYGMQLLQNHSVSSYQGKTDKPMTLKRGSLNLPKPFMGPLAPSSVSSNHSNYIKSESPNYVASMGSWVD